MDSPNDGRYAPKLDSHVQSQFPGEFPSTFSGPYKPPGLAAEYYGDHGESVADQPGIRPQPPSIIQTVDQAHLQEPTAEPAPPAEPSSMGQVGAAASFFASTGDIEGSTPGPPGKVSRPNMKPPKHSSSGASPRTSPGPEGRPTSFSDNTGAAGAAAMGVAGGLANEYYSTMSAQVPGQGGFYTSPTSNTHDDPYMATAHTTSARPPRPPKQHSSSNSALYGAAAGIAAGAGAHYLGHQNSGQGPYIGHGQQYSSSQHGSSLSMAHRRTRRGPLGKLVNFFRDPEGVAKFEEYSEAIGVCRYCFDPNSSPRDAPRKHHHGRRYSGGKYGSNTRVDKVYRQHSSDEERRRKSSLKKPMIAGALAGYGLAKIGENVLNAKDFDDTYSVRTGHPNEMQMPLREGNGPPFTRKGRSSLRDHVPPHHHSSHTGVETKFRKDKQTGELYEEQRSRRRWSSRSSSGSDTQPVLQRGAALSAGVLAAGAKEKDRRKRSRSPKRRYYHKRVSPRHSYVDLSNTVSGGAGIGSFFTSPSANRQKGKKPKGFFSFNDASSSSSDADLAFGEGSVRRKKSKQEKYRREDDGNVDTAILGLAATGAALAAASSRHESKKRQKPELIATKERRDRDSRVFEKRGSHAKRSSSSEETSAWEDASDDEHSDESALAYGSRLSARQSRESLGSSDGTSKWAWRWNRGKPHKSKKSPEDRSTFPPAAAGLAGAALNTAVSSYGRPGIPESETSLPAMQQLYPVPTSDPGIFDVARQNSTAISQLTPLAPSVTTSTVPLQHPQPIMPVSPAVYTTTAPSNPPVYSSSTPSVPLPSNQMDTTTNRSKPKPDSPRQDNEARSRRRRESSPSRSKVSTDVAEKKPRRRASTKEQSSSVKFDLTEEQTHRERRAHRRERRHSRRDQEEGQASREDSAQRRLTREQEIERELERLYEEDRRQSSERQTRNDSHAPSVSDVTVAAAGAVAGAAIADFVSRSGENRRPGDSQAREISVASQQLPCAEEAVVGGEDESERRRQRLAQKVAIRVKTSPSPVQHDNYAAYFTPPELHEKLKERNDAAERRRTPEPDTPFSPTVIEIAPKGESSPTSPASPTSAEFKFDPYHYIPFGIRSNHDPSAHSWPVPRLDLIEPTPPHSARGSVRGQKSPIPPASPESSSATDPKPQRTRSDARVSWGEHETHEYDVVTPLDDLEEFTEVEVKSQHHPESSRQENNPVVVEIKPRDSSQLSDRYSSTEGPKGFGHDLEFAAALAAGAQEAGFDPSIVIDDPTYHRRDSPPGSENTGFYQSPFAETVSDLDAVGEPQVPSQVGFIEGELPPTPKAEDDHDEGKGGDETENGINGASKSKLSKKEKRRLEKAARRDQEVLPPVMPETEAIQTRSQEPESVSSGQIDDKERKVPGGFNVFDYIDENPTPDANETVKRSTSADAEGEYFPNLSAVKPTVGSRPDPGPEREAVTDDRDALWEAAVTKPRRSSMRGSDAFYDDRSVISTPAKLKNDSGNGKKSRRRSRKDDNAQEDTGSVVSMPANPKSERDSKRESKDKKSSGIFGFFSSGKSDNKSPTKDSDDGRNRREESASTKKKGKRKSKERDNDDSTSVRKRSRSGSRSSVRQGERHHSPDDEIESFEVAPEQRPHDTTLESEEVSFLGERPEVPTVSDGGSGSTTERKTAEEVVATLPSSMKIGSPPSTAASNIRSEPRNLVVGEIDGSVALDPVLVSTPQLEQNRSRWLSELRTMDLSNSPLTTSSPTAVPIHFRRLPVSPSAARSASVGAPSAASSPSSPLTLRPRQVRPSSTEFRSKEFRPLWLVERHAASNQTEVEESYPSLPSSRTSSAHPSMEDLRGGQETEDVFASEQASSQPSAHRRSSSYSYWQTDRAKSPDFLDSRTATPTATEFPREIKKEKPKYEFHSPSELLEDPATLHEQPEIIASPVSPVHLPRPMSSEPSDLESKPPLPTSRSSSPTNIELRDDPTASHKQAVIIDSPMSPMHLPQSLAFEFSDLESLPALPKSRPSSPTNIEPLQDPAVLYDQPEAVEPPKSPTHLPRLPSFKFSESECLPPLPDSRSSSPLIVDSGLDQQALATELSDNEILPALPHSGSSSPFHGDGGINQEESAIGLSNDEILPALPDSRSTSPLNGGSCIEQEDLLTGRSDDEILPALPDSRSSSPLDFDSCISQGEFATRLSDVEILPALPESRPPSALEDENRIDHDELRTGFGLGISAKGAPEPSLRPGKGSVMKHTDVDEPIRTESKQDMRIEEAPVLQLAHEDIGQNTEALTEIADEDKNRPGSNLDESRIKNEINAGVDVYQEIERSKDSQPALESKPEVHDVVSKSTGDEDKSAGVDHFEDIEQSKDSQTALEPSPDIRDVVPEFTEDKDKSTGVDVSEDIERSKNSKTALVPSPELRDVVPELIEDEDKSAGVDIFNDIEYTKDSQRRLEPSPEMLNVVSALIEHKDKPADVEDPDTFPEIDFMGKKLTSTAVPDEDLANVIDDKEDGPEREAAVLITEQKDIISPVLIEDDHIENSAEDVDVAQKSMSNVLPGDKATHIIADNEIPMTGEPIVPITKQKDVILPVLIKDDHIKRPAEDVDVEQNSTNKLRSEDVVTSIIDNKEIPTASEPAVPTAEQKDAIPLNLTEPGPIEQPAEIVEDEVSGEPAIRTAEQKDVVLPTMTESDPIEQPTETVEGKTSGFKTKKFEKGKKGKERRRASAFMVSNVEPLNVRSPPIDSPPSFSMPGEFAKQLSDEPSAGEAPSEAVRTTPEIPEKPSSKCDKDDDEWAISGKKGKKAKKNKKTFVSSSAEKVEPDQILPPSDEPSNAAEKVEPDQIITSFDEPGTPAPTSEAAVLTLQTPEESSIRNNQDDEESATLGKKRKKVKKSKKMLASSAAETIEADQIVPQIDESSTPATPSGTVVVASQMPEDFSTHDNQQYDEEWAIPSKKTKKSKKGKKNKDITTSKMIEPVKDLQVPIEPISVDATTNEMIEPVQNVQELIEPSSVDQISSEMIRPILNVQKPAEPSSVDPISSETVEPVQNIQEPTKPNSVDPTSREMIEPVQDVQESAKPSSVDPISSETVKPDQNLQESAESSNVTSKMIEPVQNLQESAESDIIEVTPQVVPTSLETVEKSPIQIQKDDDDLTRLAKEEKKGKEKNEKNEKNKDSSTAGTASPDQNVQEFVEPKAIEETPEPISTTREITEKSSVDDQQDDECALSTKREKGKKGKKNGKNKDVSTAEMVSPNERKQSSIDPGLEAVSATVPSQKEQLSSNIEIALTPGTESEATRSLLAESVHQKAGMDVEATQDLVSEPIHEPAGMDAEATQDLVPEPIHEPAETEPEATQNLVPEPVHEKAEMDLEASANQELLIKSIHEKVETDREASVTQDLFPERIDWKAETDPEQELLAEPIHKEAEIDPEAAQELLPEPTHGKAETDPEAAQELLPDTIHQKAETNLEAAQELIPEPIHQKAEIVEFAQSFGKDKKRKKNKKKRQQSTEETESGSYAASNTVRSAQDLVGTTTDMTTSVGAGPGLTAAVTAAAMKPCESDRGEDPDSDLLEADSSRSFEKPITMSEQLMGSGDQPQIVVENVQSSEDVHKLPTESINIEHPAPVGKEMEQLPGPRLGIGHKTGAESDRNRDSGIQVPEQILQPEGLSPATFRDSGYIPSPITQPGWGEASNRTEAERPPRPLTPTSSSEDLAKEKQRLSPSTSNSQLPHTTLLESTRHREEAERIGADVSTREAEINREPSPVDSTTKDRSSALFNSPASHLFESFKDSGLEQPTHVSDYLQSPSLRPTAEIQHSTEYLAPTVATSLDSGPTEMGHHEDVPSSEPYRSIFGPPSFQDPSERSSSPSRTALQTIPEDDHEDEKSPCLRRQRSPPSTASPAGIHTSGGHSPTPNLQGDNTPDMPPPQKRLRRSGGSGDIRLTSSSSEHSDGQGRLQGPSQELERSASPSISNSDLVTAAGAIGEAELGTAVVQSAARDDAVDEDAKSLGNLAPNLKPTTAEQHRRARQADVESLPSSSTYDPVNDKGKEVVRDMADVYVRLPSLFVLHSV